MQRPIAAVLAALCLAAPAQAKPYKFKTLDYKKTDSTLPAEINTSGMIVGNYITANGKENCFTSDGKTKTAFSNPDEKSTICGGINAHGDIVGYYPANTNLGGKAFLYTNGAFTAIKPPGSSGGAIAYGINDCGDIIGTYVDAGGAQHGFLRAGRKYTSFDAPGEAITLGISINNSGDFTVQSADSNGNEHSFINIAGAYTELLFPGATSTRVHQINNAGVAAMGWIDSSGNEQGGLYESKSATYITVDVPNAAITGVEGINDSDTLVGIFATPTGTVYEGFVATGKP
jgi:hypothetical protein